MPTQWSTHSVEFKGGLISNMSPLQQGINAQGSSTILQNMESDRQGGYTKIKGYQKFSSTQIPGTNEVKALKVVSSGRAVVGREIDTAAVTTMQTATAKVNGATSSSTSVVLDNNSGTITVGMFVTAGGGSGLTGTVTVTAVTDQNNITLSSAQSLVDNADLTFGDLSSNDVGKTAYYYGTGTTWTHLVTAAQVGGAKNRKASFNFDGDDKTVFVDGLHYPLIYNANGNTAEYLTSASTNINTDVEGSDLVVVFKNTGFYAKGSTILFTAPFSIDNFSAADGAGSISVGSTVTGLIVFREQLIIFTQDAVKKLDISNMREISRKYKERPKDVVLSSRDIKIFLIEYILRWSDSKKYCSNNKLDLDLLQKVKNYLNNLDLKDKIKLILVLEEIDHFVFVKLKESVRSMEREESRNPGIII